MSDGYHRFAADLMEHVVAVTPEPPDWPGEPEASPVVVRPPVRWGVALASFGAVLVLGALALFFSRDAGVDVAGGSLVVTTPDGVALQARLWEGNEVGVLVVGAYGAVAGELDPIIEPLADRGFTVLTHDLRGHGESAGEVQPELLDDDLRTVARYLGARTERVYVVAYRHAGAAALSAAGADALEVDGLATVFALERYLSQDALAGLPTIDVPLLLIGATLPMSRAAPAGTVFATIGPGPAIFTESGEIIADQVAQFIADSAD